MENSSKNDSTNLTTDWGTDGNLHKSFDIHQTYPVYALWLYINRTSGDGTMKYKIYDIKIKY